MPDSPTYEQIRQFAGEPNQIYARALLQYDVGGASAGGVVAIILANVVAYFLVRSIARRLEV